MYFPTTPTMSQIVWIIWFYDYFEPIPEWIQPIPFAQIDLTPTQEYVQEMRVHCNVLFLKVAIDVESVHPCELQSLQQLFMSDA